MLKDKAFDKDYKYAQNANGLLYNLSESFNSRDIENFEQIITHFEKKLQEGELSLTSLL